MRWSMALCLKYAQMKIGLSQALFVPSDQGPCCSKTLGPTSSLAGGAAMWSHHGAEAAMYWPCVYKITALLRLEYIPCCATDQVKLKILWSQWFLQFHVLFFVWPAFGLTLEGWCPWEDMLMLLSSPWDSMVSPGRQRARNGDREKKEGSLIKTKIRTNRKEGGSQGETDWELQEFSASRCSKSDRLRELHRETRAGREMYRRTAGT